MSKPHDIERTSQSYTLEEADCVISSLREKLETIENYTELGLNSAEPKHWEAALQDILSALRSA
jgi:hypothetical protein